MTNSDQTVDRNAAAAFVERKESRPLQIYRVSVVETVWYRGFCVVRNVSSGGAMIRTALSMMIADAIELVQSSDIRSRGHVRWQKAASVGIEFERVMSVSAMLARGDYEAAGRRSRRLPRLDILVPIVITDTSGTHTVVARDISTHGLRLACTRTTAPGPLRITLPRFADIPAHLLWGRDGECGCLFETPLDVDELTRWVNGTDSDELEPVAWNVSRRVGSVTI